MSLKKQWEILFPQKETVKLDKKDLMIIQSLHNNSRATLSSIGKQVKLSKKNIARRIDNLESKGIITGYHIFVDLFKLGFNIYQIKIESESTLLEKQQYIERISKLPFVIQVLVLQSKEGLLLRIAVKDKVQNAIEKLTKNIIINKFEISEVTRISIKSLDIVNKKPINTPWVMCKTDKQEQIDATDVKILSKLSDNSRIQVLDLSRKLKISKDIINYRKKKLSQNNLVVKYFAAFNQYMLGYQIYILTIETFDYNLKNKLILYLGSLENTTGVLETINSKAITSFLFFKNMNELIAFERELLKKFNDIKKHEFILVREQPTYRFLPNIQLSTN